MTTTTNIQIIGLKETLKELNKIITNGPGDRKALQKLLELADKIRAAKIGLIDGRPTVVTIGGGEYAAYDLTIHTKVAP